MVLVEIGIEQQHRDPVTVRRGVGVEPRAEPDRPSFDLDGDHRMQREAPAFDLHQSGCSICCPLPSIS